MKVIEYPRTGKIKCDNCRRIIQLPNNEVNTQPVAYKCPCGRYYEIPIGNRAEIRVHQSSKAFNQESKIRNKHGLATPQVFDAQILKEGDA